MRALGVAAAREDAEQIAGFLGFEGQLHTRALSSPTDVEIDQRVPGPGELSAFSTPTPTWHVHEVSFSEKLDRPTGQSQAAEPSAAIECLARCDLGRDPNAMPPPDPSPVAPWSRLRRAMEDVCRCPRPHGDVDIDAAMRRIGRGEPIVRMPRRLRRARVPRLVVLFDRVPRLLPFWRDQLEVFLQLRREFGELGVAHAWWTEGPPAWRSDAAAVAGVDPQLEPGDIVLVLGDLGHYGSETTQRRWVRLGAALRRREISTAALLLCPAARWRSEVVAGWRAVDWSRPGRARDRSVWLAEALDARRDCLLTLLSWTVRTEPALLRAVRVVLGADEADIGTEADAWNHAEASHHGAGLVWSERLRRHHLDKLEELMAKSSWRARLLEVVEVVRRHHVSLPREIWLEELRTLASLDPGGGWIEGDERERVVEFTRKVRGSMEGAGALGAGVDVRGWAERSTMTRLPSRAWDHPGWRDDLVATFEALYGAAPEMELPPGLAVEDLPQPEDAVVRRWVVRCVAEGLEVGAEGSLWPIRRGVGSPIVTIEGRSRISVGVKGSDRAVAYRLDPRAAIVVSLPEAEAIVLATEVARAELRLEVKPEWAHAGGRDAYGLWASFRVKGVEVRMRWIAPGRFVMGSPASEQGRYDDEGPQHEVTLSQGYWMAETPCTQELWVAVMENNPSQFKSPRRPVEKVSWDDVEKFMNRLNGLIEEDEGPKARLPTEAEWEHACRAGTTTATYAGAMDIRGERNAPVVDEIAWYGGNSGVKFDLDNGYDSSDWPEKQYPHTRAGTREVALKEPNAWGLYDMLGNVFEWCADVNRDYEAVAVEDPGLVEARGPKRVIRGGSWFVHARYVRAAVRDWSALGARRELIGFRLIRGQGLRKQASGASMK